MSINANNKNYRLADMSMKPDGEVPYPDPDESKDPDTTCNESHQFFLHSSDEKISAHCQQNFQKLH